MSSQGNKQNPLDAEVETVNAETPLMVDTNKNNKPTLATPEIDDGDDDRAVVNKPYPGVDDGFFDNGKSNTPNSRRETPNNTTNSIPNNTEKPTVDGAVRPNRHFPNEFDYENNHHHHHDADSAGSGILEEIPDINVYQHKKTLAQGMMDLALFSANANQLRYVLDSYERHPYYYPSVIFISLSLLLQVAIGVLLIWNATYNVKDEKEVCRANKINNYTVIGIFLVTVVNVFVSAFGVADPPQAQIFTRSANSTI
ncbi:hypothetical protein WA026_001041 [Henosepilachna vigintioctopunctata]|uniref:Ninjurin n=1 Tax=Henosepilachna vigintioctopunctata TaxID=420089 RepID=A0AAW1V173_9CUCU